VGRSRAGDWADLTVLGADPTQSTAALGQVRGVVLRGRWLDRAALDGKLSELRERIRVAKAGFDQPIAVDPPQLPEGRCC